MILINWDAAFQKSHVNIWWVHKCGLVQSLKIKLVPIALPKPFKSSGQIIPNCSLKQLGCQAEGKLNQDIKWLPQTNLGAADCLLKIFLPDYGFLSKDVWINMDFCVSNIYILPSLFLNLLLNIPLLACSNETTASIWLIFCLGIGTHIVQFPNLRKQIDEEHMKTQLV